MIGVDDKESRYHNTKQYCDILKSYGKNIQSKTWIKEGVSQGSVPGPVL